MQILDVAHLQPGKTFQHPLFHTTGRKLLAANTQLTRDHISALLRSGVEKVFMAESARDVLEFGEGPVKLLAVADLILGHTAETDLLTPDGAIIVQQNEQIEEHHIAALKDSGIDYVIVRPPADIEGLRATLHDLSRLVVGRVESQIRRGEYLRAPEAVSPLLDSIPRNSASNMLNLASVQVMRRRLSSRLQPVFGQLETGKSPNFQTLIDVADDLIDLMRTEPRQFSQLALMTARREDYLPDHALSVSVLSMAIATHMKLAHDLVREVIVGALLFDVGMLLVPKRIRTGSATLSELDRRRVHEHPIYSLTMMEQIPGLSPVPRIMGYQHHERLNGKGYPAAAAGELISEFSRVVSVADIYAATTNPRAYKSQKLPYNAVEELVHMAHKGFLDARVIKAFLAAIVLFPVGSWVLLSNNTQAQVVGANATRIDRPLVRPMLGASLGDSMVDLSLPEYGHIKITRAVPVPRTMVDALAAV